MSQRSDSATFTGAEVSILVGLVARIDPALYPSAKAKALIYKCQDIMETLPERLVIQGD